MTNHISRSRKKKVIQLSAVSILVSCIALFYFLNSTRSEIETQTAYEPPFSKNGQLAFIKGSSPDTTKLIAIEVADNDEKIIQGMMWRRSMRDSQGMLFIFDKEELKSFWMKNTYISLDIIYVNSLLEIVSIRENAKPLDEWSIPSEYPAQYVVEVIGGFCFKYNIKTGDRIWFKLDD